MFSLPELPYSYDALEPYIDATTMQLHHGKHHQAYVDNLNKALDGNLELQKKSIEELLGSINEVPEAIRQTVANNGGGHANHSFFWNIMSPRGGEPKGVLTQEISKQFGGFEEFKKQFTEKAMTVFGSGWAFLVVNKDGKLELTRQSFQNSPLMTESVPVLGIDVWEHAYYLKYQNRRAEYIEAWWNVVNWEGAEENFVKAR